MTQKENMKQAKKDAIFDALTYLGCCAATGIFIGKTIHDPNFIHILGTILCTISAFRERHNFHKNLKLYSDYQKQL